jgi:hypothetical protein
MISDFELQQECQAEITEMRYDIANLQDQCRAIVPVGT